MGLFTYRNLLILILLILNIFLWVKLDFYFQFLSGASSLLDFDNYFKLINDMKSGINPYSVSYTKTLGPPSVFIFYFPFSYLKIEAGRSIFTLLSIISGFLSSFLLTHYYFRKYFILCFLALSLLLFSSFPARFTIEMGQPNLVITLLITIIYFSRNEITRGLLSAFVILAKPFLIFTPFSYLRTNKSLFVKTLIYLTAGTVITLVFVNPLYYLFYMRNDFASLIYSPNLIGGLDYYNQSYGSTLARFGVFLQTKAIYSLLIPLAIFVIYKIKSFEMAVIFGILFSFVSWQHYYVILFPIFIHTFVRTGRLSIRTLLLLVLLFFWWVEFPLLHNSQVNTYTGILASHYFLSGLFLSIYLFFLTRYEALRP